MDTKNQVGDYILSIESESLSSEPFFSLSSLKTNEQINFSKADLNVILETFKGSRERYISFLQQSDEELRVKNNPIKWIKDLTSYPSNQTINNESLPLNPSRLFLKSDALTNTCSGKVPVLHWEYPTFISDNPNLLEKVEEKIGWRLCLIGAHKISLGFADWDDDAGILNLLEKMKKPEELLITLSLLDLEAVESINSHDAFFKSIMDDIDSMGSEDNTKKQINIKLETPKIAFQKSTGKMILVQEKKILVKEKVNLLNRIKRTFMDLFF